MSCKMPFSKFIKSIFFSRKILSYLFNSKKDLRQLHDSEA